jgi:hypothetical protein
MKRAIFIAIAALLVLLVYPSTHPYAQSSKMGFVDRPSVITPLPGDGPPIVYSQENEDDSDDGDLDDVAGYKSGSSKPVDRSSFALPSPGVRNIFKVWWNFMIWVR